MVLKIKDREYDIKYDKLPENELGTCNCKNAKILIDGNLDEAGKESTIRHELTHAYLFEYGITRETYTQEDLCNFIGAYSKQIEVDTKRALANIKKQPQAF